MVSRIALWCYGRAPVFGQLRASIGVIRNAGRVLVIRRNDGRGLSFPGGLAWPWETDEKALIREIQEETGLLCDSFKFAFRYESHVEISVLITVFHVQATGEPRGSWEGVPEWMEIPELQRGILRSQQYAVAQLLTAPISSIGG